MSPTSSSASKLFVSAPRNNDISIRSEEFATLMFKDKPLVRLKFAQGVLVAKENIGVSGYLPADFFLGLTTPQLSEVLLARVFPEGRPSRSELYFGGGKLSKFQELKMYRGSDRDDFCWVKFDGDEVDWREVFYG